MTPAEIAWCEQQLRQAGLRDQTTNEQATRLSHEKEQARRLSHENTRRTMAVKTATSKAIRPLIPPDESMWQRYSPHNEAPLAGATSFSCTARSLASS